MVQARPPIAAAPSSVCTMFSATNGSGSRGGKVRSRVDVLKRDVARRRFVAVVDEPQRGGEVGGHDETGVMIRQAGKRFVSV